MEQEYHNNFIYDHCWVNIGEIMKKIMLKISKTKGVYLEEKKFADYSREFFLSPLYESAQHLDIRLECNNTKNNEADMVLFDKVCMKCLECQTTTCVRINQSFSSTFNEDDNNRETFFIQKLPQIIVN